MAGKDLIIDPSQYDLNHVLADVHEIRRYNPQRHEMEQLTAIVYLDPQEQICVGYKDLSEKEFWVRGHMPGLPILPGVILCEAAAQLASFHVQKLDLMGAKMMGFGGMEGVRFRDIVRPGNRLVLVGQLIKVRRGALIVCRFQAFIDNNLVAEGQIKGIPLPEALLATRQLPPGEI